MLLLTLAACGTADDVEVQRSYSSVADHVFTSCSTSVVLDLSLQIAQEVDCMAPGTLVPFSEGGGIDFTGSAVLPYIAPAAKTALLAAVAAQGGTLQVNSAYRTVAQQYLLYRWWQEGRCGITAAATPGNSNHETGRALDVNNYSSWVGALGDQGWDHSVPGDPVHFDHLGSPDLRGADVLAFQRLWNRNHPGDPLDEDGAYGPATASKLAASPAEGFAIGACPGPTGPDFAAAAGGADLPDEATAGERIVVWVELTNTGTATWTTGTTFLGTTMPRDRASAFYDQENWVSAARASAVDHDTPPGAVGRFTFVIHAPDVTADTVLSETFGLVEEGVTWFGPEDVTIELLVRPAGSSVPPVEPVDPGSEDGVDGGCQTTPGQRPGLGGLLLFGLAAVRIGRRRK